MKGRNPTPWTTPRTVIRSASIVTADALAGEAPDLGPHLPQDLVELHGEGVRKPDPASRDVRRDDAEDQHFGEGLPQAHQADRVGQVEVVEGEPLPPAAFEVVGKELEHRAGRK